MRNLPAEVDLSSSPMRMVLAYAARCARRAQPFYLVNDRECLKMIDAAITATEGVAGGDEAAGANVYAARTAIESTHDSTSSAARAAEDADESVQAAYRAVLAAIRSADAWLYARVHVSVAGAVPWHAAIAAAQASACIKANSNVVTGYDADTVIRRDYELLQTAARRDRWTHETPVPPQFFSLCSDFDTDQAIERSGIINISEEIDAKLVEYFRRHPERLYELRPRQFEELIAELFEGFGYNIELTQRTRDGGCDVIAISNRPIKEKLLIECKRYRRTKAVGVAIVRALHGVTMAAGANKGILATTGRISQPARDYMSQPSTEWILEGRDFEGLVRWLDEYQEFQMRKIIQSTEG
jgi:hypothetical protein